MLIDAQARLIAAGIVALALLLSGAGLMANIKNTEIAQLKEAFAKKERDAATAAVDRLAKANERADRLEAALIASESVRSQTSKEKDREIRRLTTGRACLGAGVVSLLNHSGHAGAGTVPQATASALSADAAFATDTDVGTWINDARSAYDTCRDRLQAIADYFAGESKE